MEENNSATLRRAAVLLVLFVSHGTLLLVFLRERPAYAEHPPAPEVPTTIFFINPQQRLAQPETPRTPHRPTRDPRPPNAAISSPQTTAPAQNSGPASSPPVDWLAEAHRSAAEIAALGSPGRTTEAPSAPAPWDSRPLLEFTGHGLQVRIPLEIPGNLIDHCFGKMDLGHEQQTGQWERYQLGCAFRKQPPRGDLFNSLRKPPQPAK